MVPSLLVLSLAVFAEKDATDGSPGGGGGGACAKAGVLGNTTCGACDCGSIGCGVSSNDGKK